MTPNDDLGEIPTGASNTETSPPCRCGGTMPHIIGGNTGTSGFANRCPWAGTSTA